MRLIIGNKNYSSWSLRPWILLQHAGLKFDEVRVPLFTSEGDRMLGELSPSNKVPVLYADGLVLWDSMAICEFIADRYPEQSLRPESSAALAHARAISAEMHSGFQALRTAMPMNCRRRFPDFTPPADAANDIARIQTMLCEALETYSGGEPWLHGNYSISDAMFAPVVSRFHTYNIKCEGALQDYCERVLNDAPMRQWYLDAERETEIIRAAEIAEPAA